MPEKFISKDSKAGHKEIIGETIAKLILHKNGFNPYSRFLDKEAIDMIVRNDKGDKVTYNEIQIKYSKKYLNYKKGSDPKDGYWFAIKQNTFKPRENFYFMFICGDENRILIMSSLDIDEMLKKKSPTIKIEKVKGSKIKGNWSLIEKWKRKYHFGEKPGQWNIYVDKKGEDYFLRTDKEYDNIKITQYLNNFDVLK